jgi:hypothetical protein
MEIKRAGTGVSTKGSSDYFTGTVRIDPLVQAPAPARVAAAAVTFEPGSRTAWHTHPLGQTLIVTAGFGRVQRWGGPIEELRPGDVVCSTRSLATRCSCRDDSEERNQSCEGQYYTGRATCVSRAVRTQPSSSRQTPSSDCRHPVSADPISGLTAG